MLEADQLLRFFYRTGRSKGAAASVGRDATARGSSQPAR